MLQKSHVRISRVLNHGVWGLDFRKVFKSDLSLGFLNNEGLSVSLSLGVYHSIPVIVYAILLYQQSDHVS